MALIKRTELAGLLDQYSQAAESELPSVVLCFGERFLCREAADALQKSLLDRCGNGVVNAIDGDQEDSAKTLGQLMNYSLLPGLQIYRVTDSRLFHSKSVAADIWDKVALAREDGKDAACRRHMLTLLSVADLGADDRLAEISSGQWQTLFGFARPGADLAWADELLSTVSPAQWQSLGTVDSAGRYVEALKKGIPPHTLLILTAEAVDKRKQLFAFIKKEGLVIDCSVVAGASSAAQKGQKEILQELVLKTLDGFGKKMAPQVMQQFFERVGFHPVAVVTETEKLALFVHDRDQITAEDLEIMVGRTREDALFELTDAFGKRQGARTLVLLNRLLDQGMHALAILATMRNYLRKLLIFRALQLGDAPSWQSGINAGQFQKVYLPALKERGEWTEMLKGHPYALFMSFSKAQDFSCEVLKRWLGLLLAAEFRLKGAPLPPELVLQELFLTMLKDKRQ